MKSIWIEAKGEVNKLGKQLFEDTGIKDNHEYIINCHDLPAKELLKKILDVDQICFFSSMVYGSDSYNLVQATIIKLSELKVKGKMVRSCGFLLDALNSGYMYRAAREFNFFKDNQVLELNEGHWMRIAYDNNKNKYQYTEI